MQGQAVVEFMTGVGVIVLFLLAFPLLGKLHEIRLATIEASTYATWQRIKNGERLTDEALREEVAQRFFSGADVLLKTNMQHKGNGDPSWLTSKDNSLVEVNEIDVISGISDDGSFGMLGVPRRSLRLSREGLITERVSVRIMHLDDYSWLPPIPGLKISQSMAGLRNSWTGESPEAVKNRLYRASSLFPYPKGQKQVVKTVNGLLNILFHEVKLRTDLVKPDIVPVDRLQPYVD